MTTERFKKAPVIVVPHGSTSKIAKHIGCTIQAVRNALKYQCNSDQAMAIRREAMANYGGTEVSLRVQA